jgi:hypothetical protein
MRFVPARENRLTLLFSATVPATLKGMMSNLLR